MLLLPLLCCCQTRSRDTAVSGRTWALMPSSWRCHLRGHQLGLAEPWSWPSGEQNPRSWWTSSLTLISSPGKVSIDNKKRPFQAKSYIDNFLVTIERPNAYSLYVVRQQPSHEVQDSRYHSAYTDRAPLEVLRCLSHTSEEV